MRNHLQNIKNKNYFLLIFDIETEHSTTFINVINEA